MSKIITDVTSIVHYQCDKKYRELKQQQEQAEAEILQLEIELVHLERKKLKIDRQLDQLEQKIVMSLFDETR